MTTELGKWPVVPWQMSLGRFTIQVNGERGSWLVFGVRAVDEEVVDNERKEPGDYNARKVTFTRYKTSG
ncbi:MAG: hypothetical protein ACLU4J_13530 [Butyricimonas paravirosa]